MAQPREGNGANNFQGKVAMSLSNEGLDRLRKERARPTQKASGVPPEMLRADYVGPIIPKNEAARGRGPEPSKHPLAQKSKDTKSVESQASPEVHKEPQVPTSTTEAQVAESTSATSDDKSPDQTPDTVAKPAEDPGASPYRQPGEDEESSPSSEAATSRPVDHVLTQAEMPVTTSSTQTNSVEPETKKTVFVGSVDDDNPDLGSAYTRPTPRSKKGPTGTLLRLFAGEMLGIFLGLILGFNLAFHTSLNVGVFGGVLLLLLSLGYSFLFMAKQGRESWWTLIVIHTLQAFSISLIVSTVMLYAMAAETPGATWAESFLDRFTLGSRAAAIADSVTIEVK